MITGPHLVVSVEKKARIVTCQIKNSQKKLTLGKSINAYDVAAIKPNNYYAFDVDKKDVASKVILVVIDVVVHTDKDVLLVRRKEFPFQGYYALPSAVAGQDSIKDVAHTLLSEELNLNEFKSRTRLVGKFSAPKRDPRMTNVWSYAYALKLDEQRVVAGADWYPLTFVNAMSMAFDHRSIIKRATLSVRPKSENPRWQPTRS
jgi:8-oxo-dGTP diphosphatase